MTKTKDINTKTGSKFTRRVPQSFARRINWGDPLDPLRLQVEPSAAENDVVKGYTMDPLGEQQAQKIPGLLHKYAGRVLVTLVADCPIHCRFCFRRNFSYAKNVLNANNWRRILNYIADDSSISEVILSGGEPLWMDPFKLQKVVDDLDAIKHLQRLRIHTRLPIVMPEKITSDLLKVLTHSRLKKVVVIHCNHPNELNGEVKQALAKFMRARIHVLNQSVLLKNVNDSANVLAELSYKLFSLGVLPYYLHMLDHVIGAAHFVVSKPKALAVMRQLQAKLPGYLLPRLVREEAGKASKSLIN